MSIKPDKINDSEDYQLRYSRQVRFDGIGREGQKRLGSSSVLLIGCGALGSIQAELMVRAGVGQLRIIDRDFLELSNLQRQMLFDERDIADNLPKAQAAARKLALINSQVQIEPVVADVNYENIEFFLEGSDLILDGTDNIYTRFLINDAAIKYGKAWIYGACLGAEGMTMTVLPGGKPCLRCVLDEPPEPGQMETCQSAGVIGPIAAMVASFQAAEALKILSGHPETVNRHLVTIDLWSNSFRQVSLRPCQQGCPCCSQGQFDYLQGKASLSTISLCGKHSVQVRPRHQDEQIDLPSLAKRLKPSGNIRLNEFMLQLDLAENNLEITIFPDARAIIKGTSDVQLATSLYARYVGH